MLTSRRTGAGAKPGGGCMTVGGDGTPEHILRRPGGSPRKQLTRSGAALERESSIRGQESSARSPEEFRAPRGFIHRSRVRAHVLDLRGEVVDPMREGSVEESRARTHARRDSFAKDLHRVEQGDIDRLALHRSRAYVDLHSIRDNHRLAELATSPLAEEPSPSSRLHRACRPPRHATTAEPRRENVTSTALRHDERARTSICERACPCGARDV